MWQSQKQKITLVSSCEAEYVAGTTAACLGIWLAWLLGELFDEEPDAPTIFIDNNSAIQLSMNPVFHDRSKHIETHYHFIRECVEDGKIVFKHVGSSDQLADVLTTSLGRVLFQDLRARIGITSINSN